MNLLWKREDGVLLLNGEGILCQSIVRKRELHNANEVVKTVPGGKPYMPVIFPKGKWQVMRPVERTDPYLAPFYIPTNAWQMVQVWALDKDGGYDHPTPDFVRDTAYGLHSSTSRTTLGCGRLGVPGSAVQLLRVKAAIEAAMDRGEIVTLEVV